MTYCSSCAATIEASDQYCPKCGREVVRIVDARPQTVAVEGKTQQQINAEGRAVGKGIIDEGFSLIGAVIVIMLLWWLSLGLTIAIFGNNSLGWQVIGTLVLAGVGQAVLSEQYKKLKRKAEANQATAAQHQPIREPFRTRGKRPLDDGGDRIWAEAQAKWRAQQQQASENKPQE